MSEINENLEVEELSTEDKKKAINLQDLVYVKKYIDDRHYSKEEVDNKLGLVVKETAYTREEADNKFYNKTEANNTFYNKTESEAKFYKKTDTVNNALKADSADLILDEQSGSYKAIRIVSEAEYEASAKSSDTLYFVKES